MVSEKFEERIAAGDGKINVHPNKQLSRRTCRHLTPPNPQPPRFLEATLSHVELRNAFTEVGSFFSSLSSSPSSPPPLNDIFTWYKSVYENTSVKMAVVFDRVLNPSPAPHLPTLPGFFSSTIDETPR